MAVYLFKKKSARIIESDFFLGQCVGGDGHPAGVRRRLNDTRIFFEAPL
jgi:hypothetical protein